VKSAIKYFGPSCAVNSLIDKYNPIGMYIWKCICLLNVVSVLIFHTVVWVCTIYTVYEH
jgi:hypothetical protein